MQRFWNLVIGPLLDAADARTVTEIGVDHGATTRLLLERARPHGGVVHAIDPAPACDMDELREEFGDVLRFHGRASHDALHEIPAVDAALIDGDHNWYTVTGELQRLERTAREASTSFPLVMAHDVGWPYGRRDMYYRPAEIPDEHRHPHAKQGVVPDESDLGPTGINPWLWNATHEGGPRNGVLTAIEDFLSESGERIELLIVDGFHGIGILVPVERMEERPALAQVVGQMRSPGFWREWSRALERARARAELAAWLAAGSPAPPAVETSRWEGAPS